MVKKAAALANRDFGKLPPEIAAAIVSACDLLIAGDGHEHFVVDMLQGGAGTSTNMNANEVIANIALKLLGRPRGDYAVDQPQRPRQSLAIDQRRLPHRRPAHRAARLPGADRMPAPAEGRADGQGAWSSTT